MEEFKKPETIDSEIILNPNKVIMSKTDKEGILEFANDYFVEVSGYEEYELMGKSIYCTQHPDMPEIIFKHMWEKLLDKKNFRILIKNLAKNGKYYWAVSDFAFKIDEDTNEILAIYNRRKGASREAVRFFGKLYKKLKGIEIESGIVLSEKYLVGHLEELGKTFDELLQDYNTDSKTVKKPVAVISITPPKQEEIIKETVKKEKEDAAIKKRMEQLQAIQNKAKKVISETKTVTEESSNTNEIVKTSSSSNKKKGFFQKMFGKTDEELEAEKNRS